MRSCQSDERHAKDLLDLLLWAIAQTGWRRMAPQGLGSYSEDSPFTQDEIQPQYEDRIELTKISNIKSKEKIKNIFLTEVLI